MKNLSCQPATNSISRNRRASTAKALPFRASVSVRLIVGMAVSAVSLFAVVSTTQTSSNIFEMGDRFQVGRVDAAPHAALVVKLQPFRDRANQEFVCDTVCVSNPLPGTKAALEHRKLWVAALGSGATNPKPTTGIRLRQYELQQPLHRGRTRVCTFDSCIVTFRHVAPFSRTAQGLCDVSSITGARSYFTPQRPFMSTSLEVKLRTAASVYGPLTALLGTSPFRWYDTQLLQGTTFPAVVVQLISNAPTYALPGALTASFARVQLTVWDTDAERARAVEAAIAAFLAATNFGPYSSPVTVFANYILNTRQSLYPQTQPPQFQRILDCKIFNDDTT
jgi:hypothetical protein